LFAWDPHSRDVNACPHELTFFELAVVLIDELVKLTVAHCEAEHLFLHFFRHVQVENILLGDGRLLVFRLLLFLLLGRGLLL